jgi:hypothetical protein
MRAAAVQFLPSMLLRASTQYCPTSAGQCSGWPVVLLVPGQEPIGMYAPPSDTPGGRPEREHIITAVPALQRVVIQDLAPARLLPFEVREGLEVALLAAEGAGDLVRRELTPACPGPFPPDPTNSSSNLTGGRHFRRPIRCDFSTMAGPLGSAIS